MRRIATKGCLLTLMCLSPWPLVAQTLNQALGPMSPLNVEGLIRATGQAPSPGSLQARDDAAIVEWLQAHRSPEVIANAYQVLNKPLLRFDVALGANLEEDAPLLSQALVQVSEPVITVQQQIKTLYKRPRPFVADPRIQPCIPKEPGYAYPSGHATFYSTTGTLLAALLPERRERLIDDWSFCGHQSRELRDALPQRYRGWREIGAGGGGSDSGHAGMAAIHRQPCCAG